MKFVYRAYDLDEGNHLISCGPMNTVLVTVYANNEYEAEKKVRNIIIRKKYTLSIIVDTSGLDEDNEEPIEEDKDLIAYTPKGG